MTARPMTPARARMLARRRELVRGLAQTGCTVLLAITFMLACSITSIRF